MYPYNNGEIHCNLYNQSVELLCWVFFSRFFPSFIAKAFYSGVQISWQPQLYQILALIFILSSIKLVKNGFFGLKFALNC